MSTRQKHGTVHHLPAAAADRADHYGRCGVLLDDKNLPATAAELRELNATGWRSLTCGHCLLTAQASP